MKRTLERIMGEMFGYLFFISLLLFTFGVAVWSLKWILTLLEVI